MDQQHIEPFPSAAVQLGNVWLLAAGMAKHMLHGDPLQPGAPYIVTLAFDGTLRGFTAEHPEYTQQLTARGFVCLIDGSTPVERIANRMHAAAAAVLGASS